MSVSKFLSKLNAAKDRKTFSAVMAELDESGLTAKDKIELAHRYAGGVRAKSASQAIGIIRSKFASDRLFESKTGTGETAAVLKSSDAEYSDIVQRMNDEIGLARSGFEVVKAKISYKRVKSNPHEILALLNLRDSTRTFVCKVRWSRASGTFFTAGMIVLTSDDQKFNIRKPIRSRSSSDFVASLLKLKTVADRHARGKIKVTASTVASIKEKLEKFKFTVTVEGGSLEAVHQAGEHIKVSMKTLKREDENGEEQVFYRMEMDSPLYPGADDKYSIKVKVDGKSPDAAFDLWYPAAVEAFNKTKKAWAKDVNGDIGRGYYWLSGFFAGRIMKKSKSKGKKRKPPPFTRRKRQGRRKRR